ncbi:hypothetical protein KJ765_03620 [Candidatus Micrarchaeota archaeon]|nr:hypothetical protein [Candidatus Micrarchaeota archaeon]
MDFDLMKELFPIKKPVHKLKWGIPEARFTAPIDDAEKIVSTIRKQAIFSGGGEFLEEIHFKDYGNNIYAYYILRTDKRSQEETVHFDGYMLQEKDRIGVDVTDAGKVSRDLDNLGYVYAFNREIEVWSFRSLTRVIAVFSVTGLGDFVEVALPETKIAKQRDKDSTWGEKFFARLKIDPKDIIPTDLITLQLVSMQQPQEPKA